MQLQANHCWMARWWNSLILSLLLSSLLCSFHICYTLFVSTCLYSSLLCSLLLFSYLLFSALLLYVHLFLNLSYGNLMQRWWPDIFTPWTTIAIWLKPLLASTISTVYKQLACSCSRHVLASATTWSFWPKPSLASAICTTRECCLNIFRGHHNASWLGWLQRVVISMVYVNRWYECSTHMHMCLSKRTRLYSCTLCCLSWHICKHESLPDVKTCESNKTSHKVRHTKCAWAIAQTNPWRHWHPLRHYFMHPSFKQHPFLASICCPWLCELSSFGSLFICPSLDCTAPRCCEAMFLPQSHSGHQSQSAIVLPSCFCLHVCNSRATYSCTWSVSFGLGLWILWIWHLWWMQWLPCQGLSSGRVLPAMLHGQNIYGCNFGILFWSIFKAVSLCWISTVKNVINISLGPLLLSRERCLPGLSTLQSVCSWNAIMQTIIA